MNHMMALVQCAHRTVTCAYCAVYFTPVLVYSNCVIACPGPPSSWTAVERALLLF